MSVNVKIEGDRFIDLSDEILEESLAPVKEVVKQGGALYLGEVQRRLKLRTGETAPEGEAPAFQSGELQRSFKQLPVRVSGNTVTSGIRSHGQDFGKINGLEYGRVTPEGKQVKARPFLRPAAEAVQPQIDALGESLL